MATKKNISQKDRVELLTELKDRFEKNMSRHKGIKWTDVEAKLSDSADKLWSLS
jgi:hypothetical protein